MNSVFREHTDFLPDRCCERLLDTEDVSEAIDHMMAARRPGVLVWVETNGLPKSWREVPRKEEP